MGNYSVNQKTVEGHPTYHLIDAKRKMDFGLAPGIGNFGYEFKVNAKDALHFPDTFADYLPKRSLNGGIPLMAPFANRIDGEQYYFQGKKYLLNDSLGNIIRARGSNLPIHGLLVRDPRWKVAKSGASSKEGAFVVSRLEFYRYPDLMAQFPFAHSWEVTYRLQDGKLECTTKVKNLSASNMPVHFGYHPYFCPDGPRDGWTLHLAGRKHWVVSGTLIPTGELEPAETFLPSATGILTLGEASIDGAFTDLERDAKGLAHFWVAGKTRKIEVVFDPGYNVAIAYAPLDREFVCLEPQTGPTNAFNLQHEGKIQDLIILGPGKSYRARFWIIPTGF
jgi:aldose 1-epimerase